MSRSLFGKEIRHHVNARIAGMVEAWQMERAIERFRERIVVIELIALYVIRTVVGLDDRHHAI
jgi:hypothetical protein